MTKKLASSVTQLREIEGEYDRVRSRDLALESFFRKEIVSRAEVNQSCIEQWNRMTAAMTPVMIRIKERVALRNKRVGRREAKLRALYLLKAQEEFRLCCESYVTEQMADRIRISWAEEEHGEEIRRLISQEYEKVARRDLWRQHMLLTHQTSFARAQGSFM